MSERQEPNRLLNKDVVVHGGKAGGLKDRLWVVAVALIRGPPW
jgi:hypothetical protein